MDVNTLFPSLPNPTNPSSPNPSSNNNNNPGLITTTTTTISRWCEMCNKPHALDKNGHRKCPEGQVGLPEESIEAYRVI